MVNQKVFMKRFKMHLRAYRWTMRRRDAMNDLIAGRCMFSRLGNEVWKSKAWYENSAYYNRYVCKVIWNTPAWHRFRNLKKWPPVQILADKWHDSPLFKQMYDAINEVLR